MFTYSWLLGPRDVCHCACCCGLGQLQLVLVHEQDPARGGCPFSTFFEQTPDDLVRVEPDYTQPGALKVLAYLDDWTQVGHVDARSAKKLAGWEIGAARIITQGDGHTVPLQLDVRVA